MANPIAEAAVLLRADGSVLGKEIQREVDRAMKNVRIPKGTQQALGQQMFGPAFGSQLTNTVTQSSKNTTIPDATQRTFAQKLFGPGFRNESGRAIQGTLAGLGQGQLAAQFAFFGPGGAAAATLGAGLLIAGKAAITLEQSLEVLRATTQASEEDLQKAGAAAEALGARLDLPGVTANAAAQAITELAKAGLSLEDSIAGAEGTLRLAIAAQVDTGTAARIAASGLNAFSLEGDQAAHVADLLAGASIAAQGDIGDMALALSQSAAVADQAGLSIEQLVGLITLLARQGILGSDAGTSIRTMLLRLVPTTKEATDEQERLGVQLDETRTIGEQLPEVIEQYRRGLANLTPIQRQAALQQIFGTDAIRSATVAFQNGAVGLDAATDAANRQGAAAELTEARSKGAAGAIADLSSESERLALAFGKGLAPAAEGVAGAFADAVGAAADLVEAINEIQNVGPDWFPTTQETFSVSGLDVAEAGLGLIGVRIGDVGDEADDTGTRLNQMGAALSASIAQIGFDLQAVAQTFRLAESIGITPQELQRIIRVSRGSGLAAGVQLGKSLMDGVAAGITEEEQVAINAARQSLADIQAEGERRILESIRSARGNLESLGGTLSAALGDIIDEGPLGDKLEKLNQALDDLEERTSRRQLRFDVKEAKTDLEDAQRSLQQVGVLSPRDKKAQQEFLNPFRKELQDAKVEVKKFDLKELIQQQEDLKIAAKDAAEEGLQKLIDDFENGRISAGQFKTMLNRELGPALDTIERENLGLSFERGFLRDVKTLVTQVDKLAPFIGTPGTTPGIQPIDPGATTAEVNRSIATAQAAVAQALEDANELTKEEGRKMERQIALLKKILEAATRAKGKGFLGSEGPGR